MKIGVLSDTHLRAPSTEFFHLLQEVFQGVDHVLHCGDFVCFGALEMFQQGAWEFIGVRGNMDGPEIGGVLPPKQTIPLGRVKIGLIHGGGPPQGLEERVAGAFDGLDVVVFGHSHQPHWGRLGSVWLFNPGAACGWGSAAGPTVGILEVEGDAVRGHVIPFRVREE